MINNNNRAIRGFTLVEIMIVVAIIALLAAISIPGFTRARKRAQATTLLNNLRLIDTSKEQYAAEYCKNIATPVCSDLKGYFKSNSILYNAMLTGAANTSFKDAKIANVTFYINDTNTLPSINTNGAFSDAVDSNFWSPFSSN